MRVIDRTELIPQSRTILEKMVIALRFDRFSTLLWNPNVHCRVPSVKFWTPFSDSSLYCTPS